MDSIEKVIDTLSARYENFILINDFNGELSDNTINPLTVKVPSYRNHQVDLLCKDVLNRTAYLK